MSDECPFCDANHYWSQGQTIEYKCNTMITKTGVSVRGKDCLIAELTALKKLVRELYSDARELLNDGEFGPGVFTGCIGDARSLKELLNSPKVQKIMEGE